MLAAKDKDYNSSNTCMTLQPVLQLMLKMLHRPQTASPAEPHVFDVVNMCVSLAFPLCSTLWHKHHCELQAYTRSVLLALWRLCVIAESRDFLRRQRPRPRMLCYCALGHKRHRPAPNNGVHHRTQWSAGHCQHHNTPLPGQVQRHLPVWSVRQSCRRHPGISNSNSQRSRHQLPGGSYNHCR